MPTDSEFALDIKFIHNQSSAMVNMITKLSNIQQWTQSNQAFNRLTLKFSSYYNCRLGCITDERLTFLKSDDT